MLVYARRELGLVALILFACNSSQTAPALDAVWMPEVAAVRNATFDALGSRERLDRDFRQWLSRPEVCSVSNATLRLEMAAGTFSWPDVYQLRGQDGPDFEHLRDKWREFLVDVLDSCVTARFGSLVRDYRRELASAFAKPRVAHQILRWLDGSEKERDAALRIIALAPSRVYYERAVQLARGPNKQARGAMIEIESLWTYDELSTRWATWIQDRLDNGKPQALQDLLSIALGTSVPGAPEDLTLAVRRTAARAARTWRDTTADGRSIVSDRIETLARDPDDDVRREGVLMLEPTVFAMYDEVLERIAVDDSNPRIRLIAYSKLSKQRADRIPPEQRH